MWSILCLLVLAGGAQAAPNHTRRLMQDGSYASSYASASSSGSTVSTTAFASGNAAASAGAAVTTPGGQSWSSGSVPNLGQQSPQQQQQYVNTVNSLQAGTTGGNDNSNDAQFTDLINSLIGDFGSGNSGNSGTYNQGSSPSSNQQQTVTQPTSGQTQQPSSSGLSSYASSSLDRHNMYRPRHSAATLRWSSSLEASAQQWANRCVFEHQQGSGQGENLAWGYADNVAAIDAYYAESSKYTYGQANPSNFHEVGHFTQMVWLATTDLGCAVAYCNGGTPFHVCRYYPPGNVAGQYAQNVRPPSYRRSVAETADAHATAQM